MNSSHILISGNSLYMIGLVLKLWKETNAFELWYHVGAKTHRLVKHFTCRLFVAIFITKFHAYFTAKSFIAIPLHHSWSALLPKSEDISRPILGNPNAQEFLKNTQAYCVFNSVSIKDLETWLCYVTFLTRHGMSLSNDVVWSSYWM